MAGRRAALRVRGAGGGASEGSGGGPGGGGNGSHAIGVPYDDDMPVLESVSAAIETATDLGGASGAGSEGTASLQQMLRGAPGVTAHVRAF